MELQWISKGEKVPLGVSGNWGGGYIVEWRGVLALGRLGGQDVKYLPIFRNAPHRKNFSAQNNDSASIEN